MCVPASSLSSPQKQVHLFRLVYELLANVWTIQLRWCFSQYQDTTQIFCLNYFVFWIILPIAHMFSFFKKNIDPRREKNCPRWQRSDGLELGGREFLRPSSWCLSRATPNRHQSPPGQHCTGCHSAGKSLLGDQGAVQRYCLPGRHGVLGFRPGRYRVLGHKESLLSSLHAPYWYKWLGQTMWVLTAHLCVKLGNGELDGGICLLRMGNSCSVCNRYLANIYSELGSLLIMGLGDIAEITPETDE